jgi:hypothetical protein
MFRRRAKDADESPDVVYGGLRTQALSVTADNLGKAAPDHPQVLGAVVDIPSGEGMASVVAMADGTTSMYTSTGGGTIGAGTHVDVAEKSHALLATLQRSIDVFPFDDRVDLPNDDLVQITIITPSGRRRASVPAAAFWGQEPSTVIDIIVAVQDVITAINQIQSRK